MFNRRPANRPAAPLIVLLTALLTCVSIPGSAQPLIENVPDDALFYFGWAGTESLVEPYAQSTLKDVAELVDTERLRDAWQRAQPALRQAVNDPEFQEVSKHLETMWAASVRGAMAVYVTAPPNQGDAAPGVALIWQPDSADDREGLLAGLKYFADRSTNPIELVTEGTIVGLLINNPRRVDPQAVVEPIAFSLADEPVFANALTQLDQPGPLVTYIDLPRLTARFTQELMSSATPSDGKNLQAVLDVLQPETLGPAIATAGFDGRRWRTQMHLGAAAPRTGLASLLDAPALSADDLSALPLDTAWAVSASFDTGQLMDLLRQAFTAAGPEPADQFEQGLVQASAMIGVDVEEQLIRGLGTAWSIYGDPDAAGDSLLGLTLVNPLRDPEGVEQGLRSVQMFGNMAMLQNNDPEMNWQIHTQTYGEYDIHSFPAMLASPSWSVIKGKLVIGLFPQTILAAIDRIDQPESLIVQDDFAAMREEIGTRRLTALSWIDLQRTAQSSYQNALVYENLLTGWVSLYSGQPMPMVLPPLGRVRPHLEPAQAYAWVDDAGWHYQSRMPFPGSTVLAPQGASTTVIAPLGVGIMLPALGAARRTARQMADNTQGRGIHMAMVTYAQTNQGRMPDDIGVLIEGDFFTPDYAVSAASGTALPRGIEDWPINEQADWVRVNADFVLVPNLTDDLDTNKIAVFLRPGIYNDPGTPGRGTVVRNDNSTSFEVGYAEIEMALSRQTGMTMQQLIDRQARLGSSR